MVESLRQNLQIAFDLPNDPVEWLCDLFEVLQVFDDYADGDEVTRSELDACIIRSLVTMPGNKFFQKHTSELLPILASIVYKWKASDTVEREGKHDAMSFVWRAGYYDIVLHVVGLVHGRHVAMQSAHLVMKLYGEKLDDYMKEFQHA
jgi:hypothetical protein